MRIPPTITYNREQIKPKKRVRPDPIPPPKLAPATNLHKRHRSANNLPISVANLSHQSKSKSYNYRQYNHKRKYNVPIPVPSSKPPPPRLQMHNSQPVALSSKKVQTQRQRPKYRNRYPLPIPINPVEPPLSNTTCPPPIQVQIPQIHTHLPPIPKFEVAQSHDTGHGHYRSQSQKLPDICRINSLSYSQSCIDPHSHHYSQSLEISTPVPDPSPTDDMTMQSLKPLPSEEVILNLYDFGGNIATRKLWTNYKKNVPQLRKGKDNQIDFIILVIDCTDYARLNDENYDCIQIAMKGLMNDKANAEIPMVIFANKQDLPNALSIEILEYRLSLKRVEVFELIGIMKESRTEFDDEYCGDLSLPWKVSSEIVGFLPDEDTYWNMSERHWMIFGSIGIERGDKGIKQGLKWLYDEYDQQCKMKDKIATKRKRSFAERLRFTM